MAAPALIGLGSLVLAGTEWCAYGWLASVVVFECVDIQPESSLHSMSQDDAEPRHKSAVVYLRPEFLLTPFWDAGAGEGAGCSPTKAIALHQRGKLSRTILSNINRVDGLLPPAKLAKVLLPRRGRAIRAPHLAQHRVPYATPPDG